MPEDFVRHRCLRFPLRRRGTAPPIEDVRYIHYLRTFVKGASQRLGIDRLAPGSRRKRLDQWLRDDLPLRFEGRIVPIDAAIAEAWGGLVARSEAAGRPISAMDGFIAATAVARDLELVTRNVADFRGWVKSVVNPWRGG